MAEIDELKAKFFKAYSSIPEPERSQVVVVIDKVPYSWDKVNSELLDKTDLGIELLQKMKKLGIL
jgi:hypothetical protein